MGRLSRCAIALAWGGLIGLVAGCGRAELWTRWRAERAAFHAKMVDQRVRASGSGASVAQIDRARTAWLKVAAAYPATRWVPRAAAGDTLARDIARVGAAAATRAAVLADQASDTLTARRELAANGAAYAAVWPSGFEAWLALAAAFEGRADTVGALPAWESAARVGRVVDPDSARVSVRTFLAANRTAEGDRRLGRNAAIDSLWGAMTLAIDAVIVHHHGDTLAPVLWIRRGEAQRARGGPGLAEADRSYRRALAERVGALFAEDAMRGLGETALASGATDSAVVWARRAAQVSPPIALTPAYDLETRAWMTAGRPESAAAALDRLAETRHLPLGVATDARFREGLIFERMGRLELARTVYQGVIASDPLSPSSFEAMERLVEGPALRHEDEVVDEQAHWGLDQLDRTLMTVRDPAVRALAYRTRARLQTRIDDLPGALETWATLAREYPKRPEGVEAGFQAATLAMRLNDPGRAVKLYDALAQSAPRASARDSAKAAALAVPSR